MRTEVPYAERLTRSATEIILAYEVAKAVITPKYLCKTAAALAAVRAPSGTVRYTLGPVIGDMVKDIMVDYAPTETDFMETGNPAIMINYSGKNGSIVPQVVLAHGDEVSYGVARAGQSETPLWANCAHRQAVPIDKETKKSIVPNVSFPGEALRYRETERGIPFLEQIASGNIVTNEKGNILFVTEHGPEGKLCPGDRVVFNPFPSSPNRLQVDINNHDRAVGMIDNRIGLAASILMAVTMAELHLRYPEKYKNVATIIVADDNEEGLPEGRFGKGAYDLATVFNLSRHLRKSHYFVADGHDSNQGLTDNALLTEAVSKGKGPIIEPDRVNHIDQLVRLIKDCGGKVRWDQQIPGVETSRSSDNGLKMAGVPDRQITIAGYSEFFPHHQYFNMDSKQLDPAVASIESAVQNGRLLVALNVAASQGLI